MSEFDPSAASSTTFRTVVMIVLDSLRYDSFERARTPVMDRYLPRQSRRSSYATWTLPSHACLLAGLLPFPPSNQHLAAHIYADDMRFWASTLTGDVSGAVHFAPNFCLAEFAGKAGFGTYASVAMPILSRNSGFVRGFDKYEDALSVRSLRFAAQAESALFNLDGSRPNFIFINCGDTHYPYLLPPHEMPRISGLNGALRSGDTAALHGFASDTLAQMRDSQIKAAELFDQNLQHLIAELPKPLRIVVLSDHGELFGEDNLFGHGPFSHPLLMDVPMAMGDIN